MDGELVEFAGLAIQYTVEGDAANLNELFGPLANHPLWLYSSEYDPQKHHEFWARYDKQVVLTPELVDGRWILRWPDLP
jgi:hypothetical protein